MDKYVEHFEEMLNNLKNKEIDVENLPTGSKKTIIIGIMEAFNNEKLIDAARVLYTEYRLIRAFTPIIYKMYMKA
tara:strand:+ start:960 stop:1184 length:225 start_codon:yes stop_codon:yes gene_type:complete